jgi:hypothetical protein
LEVFVARTISKVYETCKCGATFEFSGDATEVLLALARFQASHMPCRTAPADDLAIASLQAGRTRTGDEGIQ